MTTRIDDAAVPITEYSDIRNVDGSFNGLYRIPSGNWYKLTETVEKLTRKATKLGVPAIKLIVHEQQRYEIVTDPLMDTREMVADFIVSFTGDAPKVGDYTLVGVLTPVVTETGTLTMVKEVPDQTVPASYRNADPEWCDHCKTRRRRLETFIVRHDGTDEYKQVGRQCIADFLGVSVANMLASLEYLASLAAACEEGEEDSGSGRGRDTRYMKLDKFLALVACSIRRLGWTSRKAAGDGYGGNTATVDTVLRFLVDSQRYRSKEAFLRGAYDRDEAAKYWLEPDEDDQAVATSAIEYYRTKLGAIDITDSSVSSYMYNIGLIVLQANPSIDIYKQGGIAASIIAAYRRETEEKVAKAAAVLSNHVGTVGKREVFTNLTVVGVRPIPSDYGVRTMLRFRDSAGNILVWWASGEWTLKEGETISVKGTVKGHDEYKGIKQTTLTRCAVL